MGFFFGGGGEVPILFLWARGFFWYIRSLALARPSFLGGDNSTWIFPSLSSLSDDSIRKSQVLKAILACDHGIWSMWAHCLEVLLSLRKNEEEESRLLNSRRLRSSRAVAAKKHVFPREWVPLLRCLILMGASVIAISLTIAKNHSGPSARSPKTVSKRVPGASRPWEPQKSETSRKRS